MIIYIDSDYKCHISNNCACKTFDIPFFDDKCMEFIEGYRYIPAGETWTRADGQIFTGEIITPWRDYSQLSEIQSAVDRVQSQADEEMANLIEEVYNSDLEVINNV